MQSKPSPSNQSSVVETTPEPTTVATPDGILRNADTSSTGQWIIVGPTGTNGYITPTTVTSINQSALLHPALVNATITSGTWVASQNVTGTCSIFTNGTSIYYNVQNGQIYQNLITTPDQWRDARTDEQIRKEKKEQAKRRQSNIHKAKASIKRAMKLIDNVGFGDDVRVFLGGGSIEIYHPNSPFKFVLTPKPGQLIDKTIHPSYTTPYKLELYTKTEVHVADLCVYAKDTPILDQVLAVTLYIKSGDEEEILQKANWFNLTRDEDTVLELAVEHPVYENKLRLERFGPVRPPGEFTVNRTDGIYINCVNPITVQTGDARMINTAIIADAQYVHQAH